MTSARQGSLYAARLRKLGFSHVDKEFSITIRQLNSRKERRLLRKKRYAPWFTRSEILTIATDETGQTWIGPKNTDLSTLGFEEKTEEVLEDLKAFEHAARNTSRKYN